MNCNFCMKTLDNFIKETDLTPEEREKVVLFAMYMERKRLEHSIERSVTPLENSTFTVIC
jgi:hypothetical protein